MKRLIILSALLAFFLSQPADARNAHRKKSSGKKTTSTQIKSTPGTLFGVEIVATGASGGYAVIFDTADTDTNGKTELVEIREATQNDSKQRDIGPEGVKAHEGIYLFLDNATAIVHYY